MTAVDVSTLFIEDRILWVQKKLEEANNQSFKIRKCSKSFRRKRLPPFDCSEQKDCCLFEDFLRIAR